MQGRHKEQWKGNIVSSVPHGVDIGTPDPAASLAYKKKQQDGKAETGQSGFTEYYARLSPEQKHRRYLQQHVARLAGLGLKPDFGCPYCDFATDTAKGLRSHVSRSHPEKSGLVEMRSGRTLQAHAQTDANNNTDKALVDRIVAAVATMIYRDIKGKE
jgi:hypothetical protein